MTARSQMDLMHSETDVKINEIVMWNNLYCTKNNQLRDLLKMIVSATSKA